MTAKKGRRLSNSSTEKTSKVVTRAQSRLSASKAFKPSSSIQQGNVAAEPVKLFWITISDVHENVAYEDIVRALFQRCVKLRIDGANPSNLGGHFQDTVEVAFATKKDAEEAVSLFQNKIRLFRKMWRIHHHKHERSSNVVSSSGLRTPDAQEASESSDEELARIKQAIQDAAVGTGDSTKIYITNIDEKVPIEVVVPLFKTVGRVRSHEVYNNADGVFQGTVELEFEHHEDAAAAVRHFDDNITFFGKTWFISRDDDDDDDDNNDNA